MIGEKLEGATLRKDGCLFMDGAVFEMKPKFGGDTVSIR
jgi:hypothetical protein